jgi:hypothetical protein
MIDECSQPEVRDLLDEVGTLVEVRLAQRAVLKTILELMPLSFSK